jgi:uncharacterized protein (TIGR00251 family)
MKIFVTAKLKAKEKKIEKIDDNHFLVFIKEFPIKGRANKAIIKLIAKHFKIPMTQVKIVSGAKSKQKVIKIQE